METYELPQLKALPCVGVGVSERETLPRAACRNMNCVVGEIDCAVT